MMWKEFEELAGYEVSYEDYTNIIEPMYMSLEDVTKQEFVGMINKKRFALPTKRQLINKMKELARFCERNCRYQSCYETEKELEELADKYIARFYGQGNACFNRGYEFPELERGCTYPKELVIWTRFSEYGNYRELERINLI